MINIHSVLDHFEKSLSHSAVDEKFHVLKGRCRIILQVVFEYSLSKQKIFLLVLHLFSIMTLTSDNSHPLLVSFGTLRNDFFVSKEKEG